MKDFEHLEFGWYFIHLRAEYYIETRQQFTVVSSELVEVRKLEKNAGNKKYFAPSRVHETILSVEKINQNHNFSLCNEGKEIIYTSQL